MWWTSQCSWPCTPCPIRKTWRRVSLSASPAAPATCLWPTANGPVVPFALSSEKNYPSSADKWTCSPGFFRYQDSLHSEEARVSTKVPKIYVAPSDISLLFILKRHQFSLRLAFVMTINKAQAQIFGFLLQEPVFTHGQLYVAFSRVRTLDSMHIKLNPCMNNNRNPFSQKNASTSVILKVGAVVMLLRSFNPKQGLCIRHTYDINIPFILKRQEFLLGLAFPMTINKAQSQTFDRVGLLLQEPVFMHVQLYVAFSRVRTWDSIHVKVNTCIYKNINLVFNEVL
ncbi:hypothetical protein LAZ67_5002404 [Cordylochernes scorpioides]|uniref:ATP-dependent DNA helicase n=1 Tax=Cordylochernes scorpioides TaxID=51811 RepID=A0ABY6KJE7_9ARAC|nr:hypothetical protein LAZ67_5002404 [Cordylochernes scorpioides]